MTNIEEIVPDKAERQKMVEPARELLRAKIEELMVKHRRWEKALLQNEEIIVDQCHQQIREIELEIDKYESALMLLRYI